MPTESVRTCVECGLPIGADERVAIGIEGEMHYRCFKRGKAHGRAVVLESCVNCGGRIMPWDDTCEQCGVGPRIGGN